MSLACFSDVLPDGDVIGTCSTCGVAYIWYPATVMLMPECCGIELKPDPIGVTPAPLLEGNGPAAQGENP